MTEDMSITMKVPVGRKKSTKEWKGLWFELQKRPFLDASQIKNSQQIDIGTCYINKILIKFGLRAQKIAKKPSITGPK